MARPVIRAQRLGPAMVAWHKPLDCIRNGGASFPLLQHRCYPEIMSSSLLSGKIPDFRAPSFGLPEAPKALSRSAAAVAPALAAAAERAGVDFGALFHTARLESGFNPSARARTSSATGLFQFVEGTWLQMLKRHGPAYGLAGLGKAEALALRNDPGVSSLMAAEHMAENAQALEAGLGRPAGRTDLYLAHFLGLGGALRFLRKLQQAPETPGAAIFPAAARANKAIFYDGGAPRSLGGIHQLLAAKISGEAPVGIAGVTPGPRQRTAGVQAPPSLQADAPGPRAGNAGLAPADVARMAYLMLAELGG